MGEAMHSISTLGVEELAAEKSMEEKNSVRERVENFMLY